MFSSYFVTVNVISSLHLIIMSDHKESVKFDINIDKPRYDQTTYVGRARHFFEVTNPLNLLVSSRTLEDAKSIVTRYRYIVI